MSESDEKRQIGPFELHEKLGVGGMGIVYRAKYLKNGVLVAVKVLSPDLMADQNVAKRFEREMAILKKLKHPHIVKYYGGSTSGAQQFYAMELVKGGSLEQLLKKKGPVDWEQAVDYAIQIAKALEHAHAAGVIHRDLKPANLLLTKSGLKLTDFGIARDTQSTALTAAGKTLGTMAYMAPEQISGKHPVGAKTDLYALGCVVFEMLSGRTVFQSETQPEMLFKHLDEDPPSVREFNINVPLWLDELINELLEKEPTDRPYDALAVQVKLEEVREKVAQNEGFVNQTVVGGGATIKEGDPELSRILGKSKRKKKKKRKKVPFYERVWFLSLCLCGVVALLVWGFWPESEEDRFARIEAIMASTEPTDWYDAEYYIRDFLADFPESARLAQVGEWQDGIKMTRAERQAEMRETRGRDPESPAERAYMEARQFERFGDRLTALQKYEAMAGGLFTEEEEKPFVNLARRQSQKIRDSIGGEDDPAVFIREQLAEADRLYLSGEELQARSRWQSLMNLYKNLPEHEAIVHKAQARLLNPEEAIQEDLESKTNSQ